MSTIYIHWPFCLSKCNYCDFHSVVCRQIDIELWKHSYKKVIEKFKNEYYRGELITSIYFGGGTPSMMEPRIIYDLLFFINENFKISGQAEITIEVNPKTVDKRKISGFRKVGINRLSIGCQSLKDSDLKMLGRNHSVNDSIDCLDIANEFFDNISLDFIYNRPGQNIDDWCEELDYILTLPVKHLSLYELIVEKNTKLKKLIDEKKLPDVKHDSEFLEITAKLTKSYGFDMYEVSNFAKKGKEGKHNLSYWKYEDYFGIGPSAHSRVVKNKTKIAIEQLAENDKWLRWSLRGSFIENILSEDDVFKEKLIFGLRSKVGVDLKKISSKMKNKYDIVNKIKNLKKNSYIIIENNVVKLTFDGLLRLNLIIEYIVKERKNENFNKQ